MATLHGYTSLWLYALPWLHLLKAHKEGMTYYGYTLLTSLATRTQGARGGHDREDTRGPQEAQVPLPAQAHERQPRQGGSGSNPNPNPNPDPNPDPNPNPKQARGSGSHTKRHSS